MKSVLKKIALFVFICSGFIVKASEGEALIDSANNSYSKTDYAKAIKLYEIILSGGNVAPELYFNLGNAYYKSNNIARAIVNYERALKMEPHNEDFKFNLKLANQRIEDKIDAAPQLFLTQWKNGLFDLISEKGWAVLCIAMFIISLLLIGLYVTAFQKGWRQFGFFGGITGVVLSVILFFVAQGKYHQLINSNEAIISAPAITVTGAPDEKGTKLFIIHEGVKVNITQDNVDWVEIKLANGNTGWIRKTQLELI